MGLFDRSKQITTTTTDISNITNDITSVVQDSNNVITSTTDSHDLSFTDAFNSVVSQPIAILANGSDGGNFDLNSFFQDAKPSQLGGSSPSPLSGLIPLVLLAAVAFLVYRFVFKRK